MKSVAMSRDEQRRAWREAAAAIRRDVDAGVVDASRWGDDVTDGEILRIACEAYVGVLEVDLEVVDEPAPATAVTDGGDRR